MRERKEGAVEFKESKERGQKNCCVSERENVEREKEGMRKIKREDEIDK